MFLTCPAHAQDISGRVTSIHDGDTFRIGAQRIRLWGIDAVELKQRCDGEPCGIVARNALASLINDQNVDCTVRGRSHHRVVAQCFVDGRDVAEMMAVYGMAFDASYFSHGQYKGPETQARTQNAGLWALQGIETPRNWRARHPSGT